MDRPDGIPSSQERGRAMADITIRGVKANRGERMTKGNGWRLAILKGKKRVFVATLLETLNRGKERIAIFGVPK